MPQSGGQTHHHARAWCGRDADEMRYRLRCNLRYCSGARGESDTATVAIANAPAPSTRARSCPPNLRWHCLLIWRVCAPLLPRTTAVSTLAKHSRAARPSPASVRVVNGFDCCTLKYASCVFRCVLSVVGISSTYDSGRRQCEPQHDLKLSTELLVDA